MPNPPDREMMWCCGLLGIAILFSSYFLWQKGRVHISSEYAQIFMLRGGYRSWGVDYSWGHQQQPDGSWKNIWKKPGFYHSDIRKIQGREDEKNGR